MARSPAISVARAFSGSFEAESVLGKYLGVKAGSDDHQVTALTAGQTSGTVITGVNQNEQNIGDSARVVLLGPSMARCSGGTTRDYLLESDYSATAALNGAMVTIAVLANALMIAAIALEDAADLEYFKVMVIRQMQLAVI